MIVRSIREKADLQRTRTQIIADWLTEKLGSVVFLGINLLWFSVWIILNSGIIPDLVPFDPFPFGLLTMIVSLEAIGLAIIVLISQNREEQVSELRQEVDLQLDVLSDKKISRMLQLLLNMARHQHMDVEMDEELLELLDSVDIDSLEKMLGRSK